MALNAGDIAFVGINTAGGPDDWVAFTTLADIPAGTVIYFSDNEISPATAAAFNTGESYSKWTAPVGGVAAGTVITLTNFDIAGGPVANIGSAAAVTFSGSANRGFSQTADAVYAYLAASDATVDTPTTHLARISLGNAEDGTKPTSLPDGSNIVFTSGQEGALYSGPHTGLQLSPITVQPSTILPTGHLSQVLRSLGRSTSQISSRLRLSWKHPYPSLM